MILAPSSRHVPAAVKLTRAIRGYATTEHWLCAAQTFDVEQLDPDGLGVSVRTRAGELVSLHPSEFEVIRWASPKESDMATASLDTPRSRSRKGGASAAKAKPSPSTEPASAAAPAEHKPTGPIIPPGATSTTTPAGILHNDPSAVGFDDRPPVVSQAARNPPHRALPKTIDSRVMLDVKSLARHPKNRVPAEADVAARAESLREDGQLEDIVVRRPGFRFADAKKGTPAAEYEIISGETRWRAAQSLGWSQVRCTVIECDDAEALRLVATYNGQREDLNPIQRAQLIEDLCAPVEQGGAGLTREAAARSVGLGSGSAASNLVRLLKLPKVWQERVASGELAESFARLLVPVAHIKPVMDELEQDYTSKNAWDREYWRSREELEDAIDNILDQKTRRFDEERYISKPGIGYGRYKCLIHPDDVEANRRDLKIVTLSVTEDGKTREVEAATNVELWDEMQEEAIRKHVKALGAVKAKKIGQAVDDEELNAKLAAAKDKPKTKAQLEQAAKERAEQLKRSIGEWKEKVMRREVQAAILALKPSKTPDARVLKLILHFFGEQSVDVMDVFERLAPKAKGYAEPYELLTKAMADNPVGTWLKIAGEVCALLVGGGEGHRPAELFDETLAAIFAEWNCDLEAAWRRLYQQRDPLIEEFFQMHRKAELEKLADELSVYLDPGASKETAVRLLSRRDSPTWLPLCLKPQQKRETKGKAKKGR